MNKKKASMQKVYWSDIRDQVLAVNPSFAVMIDEYAPNKNYYFYKATYPYGALVLDKAILMLPNEAGQIVSIKDVSIDDQIRKDLEYNLNSNPVSMILANTFEIFYPLESSTVPMNGLMKPGAIFGTFRVLNPQRSHQPKFLWDMTAGARSLFMLPKITEERRHYQLQKKFDIDKQVPLSLMQHWNVFKDLANHPEFPQDWNAEILFFPECWFKHLEDKDWIPFYYHLYRIIWNMTEFWRNQPFWHLVYSIILNEFQRKTSSYITDTVKYLMQIGTGAQPGFAPATDSSAAPITGIQQVYYDVYGLKKYPSIVMVPTFFDLNNPDGMPVYYSLQFPTAIEFGQSTRTRNSFVNDLHEIRSLLIRYESEILSGRFDVDNTPLMSLFKNVDFSYFHAIKDLRSHMKNSEEIMREDVRFSKTLNGMEFPSGLSQKIAFMNGCIRISHKGLGKVL